MADEEDISTTARLLGEFAEMMHRLDSSLHPDLDAFVEAHRDEKEFVRLAKVSRSLWRMYNGVR